MNTSRIATLLFLTWPLGIAQADLVQITVSGTLTAAITDPAGVDGANFELVYRHNVGEIWEIDPVGDEFYTSIGLTSTLTLSGTPGGVNDGVYIDGSMDNRFGDFGAGPRMGVFIPGVGWVQTSDGFALNSGAGLEMEPLQFTSGTTPIAENALVVPENFGDLTIGISGRAGGALPVPYTLGGVDVQIASVIPEPSSCLFVGMIATLTGTVRRRCRRSLGFRN